MPELDQTNTDNESEYDPTSAGGEVDNEFENDDFENADRGDTLEVAQVEPEPEIPEPEAETEVESESTPEVVETEEAPEVEVPEEETPEEIPEEKPVKKQRIPKERFDEINERRKAAELQNRELQAKLDAKEAKPLEDDFDFDVKEQEYMEHMLDGELDKAKVVRAEIRSAEQRQYQAMTSNVRDEAVEATQMRQEYMTVVEQLQTDFSEFDPEGEDFNQDLIDEVLEMKDAFVARQGNTLSPGKALKKAANYVAKMNDLKTANYEEPVVEKEVEAVDLKKVVSKKATNVKEKVKQANAQPPVMDNGETDSKGSPNITEMDEDEFDALPEATKRRLRGDVVI